MPVTLEVVGHNGGQADHVLALRGVGWVHQGIVDQAVGGLVGDTLLVVLEAGRGSEGNKFPDSCAS